MGKNKPTKKTSHNDKIIDTIIIIGILITICAVIVYLITWQYRENIVNIICIVCIILGSLFNIFLLSREKDKQ